MQIDYALILSAGLGTRMGDIGKIIPKVMWPILDKKLIDLQICYCRELGIKKIFINTHYLADVIKNHIKNNYDESIVLLHEDPLLDSGGAIHNLAQQASVNYKGNLLTVNGDQFLMFNKSFLKEALSLLQNSRAVLFGIQVDKEENYNETVLNGNKLIDIIKNSRTRDYITFSGLGLIKLDGLTPVYGPTKFFQTVANYKTEDVKMIIPENMEYWDFGTAEIYYRSIEKLYNEVENKNSQFVSFLKSNHIKLNEIERYYDCNLNSINLEGKALFERNAILGCGKIQKIF